MNAMKKLTLALIALSAISCTTDSANDTSELNLVKIESFYTNSDNPTSNNRKVTYFENNEAFVDSTFDYQNQFLRRTVVTNAGLTKTIKVFTNAGELAEHREENYDSQGRIVGRHTYEPPSALYFTYVYNDNGTVDSKYFSEIDNQIVTFRTFTKNTAGLLFKQNFSAYNFTSGQTESYEYIANIQDQKLVSVNEAGVNTAFQYYPNPMPENIQKSVNELNNLIVKSNELRYLAYNGNYYFKIDDNIITTFNSDNYITHSISTNNSVTTEKFYYYD